MAMASAIRLVSIMYIVSSRVGENLMIRSRTTGIASADPVIDLGAKLAS
jgi:hypothetical protein